ncbi:MAG: c-type cytochrome [Nitrospinota bacterium]|nr:c-type cytochrome [Nitrospinota bacterium]
MTISKPETNGYVVLCFILLFTGFIIFPNPLLANEERAGKIIKEQCTACHRVTGGAKSRFELKAPDLMWAGVKFKRPWLVSFLKGNEKNVYQKNYRWDLSREPVKHIALSNEEAEAVADYIKKHLVDPRVKKDAIDLTHFTELQASFGKQLFIDHSCTGCHQIMDNGKAVGGLQSATFFNSGKRLKKDWILRFNSNPPDFVPHSGEFVADVSELGLHYVTGYLATVGDDSFKFYEPWKSEHFKNSSSNRGKVIYKEYCAQCHGAKGEGDGPAAAGLEPKPAVHAKMALDQFPMDYLYNVVYYGGKAVGKSHYMPYWGLTIGKQGVADVIAYMRETFKGGEEMAAAPGKKARGDCPQKRTTKAVSFKYKNKKNPLQPTSANLQAGEALFQKNAKPMACQLCHGKHGDGKGPGGAGIKPAPRNFTCAATMKSISDGQMFGIIKEGSPGTAMPAFKSLKDEQVWQLIHYIRGLVR